MDGRDVQSLIETIEFRGIEAFRLLAADGSSAVVSRFGAQVLSWITRDGRERLFLGERARFDGRTAIRGGIPVCFPQFAAMGELPRHGLLRTRIWEPGDRSCSPEYAMLTLEAADTEATRALWPHAFKAELTVVLERDRLDIELSVDNTGDTPLAFTAALHSYLRVAEVEDIALAGLYGFLCRGAAGEGGSRKETAPELLVDAEIDRLYTDVDRPLLLQAGNHSLGVHKDGFRDVVVWNPWADASSRLADLEAHDFRHFLCVEAAAAAEPVNLAAGESWSGRQTLVVL